MTERYPTSNSRNFIFRNEFSSIDKSLTQGINSMSNSRLPFALLLVILMGTLLIVPNRLTAQKASFSKEQIVADCKDAVLHYRNGHRAFLNYLKKAAGWRDVAEQGMSEGSFGERRYFVKRWRDAAEQGMPEGRVLDSLIEITTVYGGGGDKDIASVIQEASREQAADCLRGVADQGDEIGQFFLAALYRDRKSVV
ncbi:MAG: hypothetical protein LBT46_03090, partial [Planctomycetaceae bacterium]|nr:hypothetical protein [Planctomycetaceae bacterium]